MIIHSRPTGVPDRRKAGGHRCFRNIRRFQSVRVNRTSIVICYILCRCYVCVIDDGIINCNARRHFVVECVTLAGLQVGDLSHCTLRSQSVLRNVFAGEFLIHRDIGERNTSGILYGFCIDYRFVISVQRLIGGHRNFYRRNFFGRQIVCYFSLVAVADNICTKNYKLMQSIERNITGIFGLEDTTAKR